VAGQPSGERIPRAEIAEQREIPVAREQGLYPVRHAQCGDPRVVDDSAANSRQRQEPSEQIDVLGRSLPAVEDDGEASDQDVPGLCLVECATEPSDVVDRRRADLQDICPRQFPASPALTEGVAG
jgi:hypothetical protein